MSEFITNCESCCAAFALGFCVSSHISVRFIMNDFLIIESHAVFLPRCCCRRRLYNTVYRITSNNARKIELFPLRIFNSISCVGVGRRQQSSQQWKFPPEHIYRRWKARKSASENGCHHDECRGSNNRNRRLISMFTRQTLPEKLRQQQRVLFVCLLCV